MGVGRPSAGSGTYEWDMMWRSGSAQQMKREVEFTLASRLMDRLETDEELAGWVEDRLESGAADRLREGGAYRQVTSHAPEHGWSDEELVLHYESAFAVSKWAQTSGDHDAQALATQLVAAELWGGEVWDSPALTEAQALLDGAVGDRAFRRAFLQEMYAQTQSEMASVGLESLTVVRGMKWGDDGFGDLTGGKHAPPDWASTVAAMSEDGGVTDLAGITSNPMSSWSASRHEARQFASTSGMAGPSVGTILTMEVPASRVLAMPFTGYGCLGEYEVVLVGGGVGDTVRVEAWSDDGALMWGGD